jgi:hypothetical protein
VLGWTLVYRSQVGLLKRVGSCRNTRLLFFPGNVLTRLATHVGLFSFLDT